MQEHDEPGRVCSEHIVEDDFIKKGRFKNDGSFEMARTNVLKHSIFTSRKLSLEPQTACDLPCSQSQIHNIV